MKNHEVVILKAISNDYSEIINALEENEVPVISLGMFRRLQEFKTLIGIIEKR